MRANRELMVVVDPDKARREAFTALARRYFEVFEASSQDLGFHTIKSMEPTVAVVHIEQSDSDGLELCKRLRLDPPKRDCMLVVHGADPDASQSMGAILRVRTKVAADVYLNYSVSPESLLRVIARRMENGELIRATTSGPLEFVSASIEPPPPLSRAEVFQHRINGMVPDWIGELAQGIAASAAPMLQHVRPLRPRHDRLPLRRGLSLGQVLLCRVSLHNLIAVCTSPLTPIVYALPIDRRPTKKEILLAYVCRENLEIIFRRTEPQEVVGRRISLVSLAAPMMEVESSAA